MSPTLAIIVVASGSIAAFALYVFAMRSSHMRTPFVAVVVLAILALGIVQTGGLRSANPGWFVGKANAGELGQDKCERVLKLLEDRGLITEEGGQTVLSPTIAAQLPQQAREVVDSCIRTVNTPGADATGTPRR